MRPTKYMKHIVAVNDDLLFWCAGTFYIHALWARLKYNRSKCNKIIN